MADRPFYHTPVLVGQVLQYLNLEPGKVYVDATFGGGGHTRAILLAEPQCQVIAIDWDMIALEKNGPALQQEFPGRITFVWGNFAQISKLLAKIGVRTVDGILADFGTSMYQIHERAGFSFAQNTPLDMRMSPAHQKVSAAHLVNTATESKLADIFWHLGQDRHARKIAQAIVQERKKRPIDTTGQLAELIERMVPRQGKRIHPATQIFQALRIYVNKELENIHSFLCAAYDLINPGGRMVCISFHSLEDRMVKQFFVQHEYRPGMPKGLEIVTKRIVIADADELSRNPSSRSARLRAAQLKVK